MAAVVVLTIVSLFREDLKALFLRVAKIRFPGGAEVSTSQTERQERESSAKRDAGSISVDSQADLPPQLTPQQKEDVLSLLRAEQATSRVWEYRFLNYFFVIQTQRILDWLSLLPQPVSYSFYDTQWLPIVPDANERSTIINVLQSHHLLQIDNQYITVTEKGREYQQWRGPLPEPS
jgi:hypothetical protein